MALQQDGLSPVTLVGGRNVGEGMWGKELKGMGEAEDVETCGTWDHTPPFLAADRNDPKGRDRTVGWIQMKIIVSFQGIA